MFCSTNSGISLPQQLSPGCNPAAALGGFNDEDAQLDHDCRDFLFHCLLESPTDKTMSSTKSMSISPEVYPSNGDLGHPLRKHRRWQSEKKDRHSKIFTAQGPRNRRVRLSIDVGRKFFYLQDLLGFDKASKTLDWLLRKSKTAIKELIQMKHVDDPRAKSLCSSSECENLDLHKSTASKKKKMLNPANPKEAKGVRRAAFDAVAKELRARARARARERTKEKILLRKLTEAKRLPYLNPSISNQPRTLSQIESCSKASDSYCHNTISSVNINSGLSRFFFFQPNLIISTESSSNFSQCSQNWDIRSSMTSSSLCALTNMASLGERQISRKPFYLEEHTATTIKSNVVETLSM